jgi:hypothetical protein
MTKQDQAPVEKTEQSKSFDTLFDEGWEATMGPESATEKKVEATKEEKTSVTETEDTKKSKDSTSPYKTLKVNGKDIPVASEDELIALAQKGYDYTQKTQTLSKERKDAEAKIKTEHDALSAGTQRLNDMLDRLATARPDLWKEIAKGKEDAAPSMEDTLKEFDIDAETAMPSEKKMAPEIVRLRDEIKSLKEMVHNERTERAVEKFESLVEKERVKYPFEDTFDDQGQIMTPRKLEAIIMEKKRVADSAGDKFDIIKSAREAVKELYESQQEEKQNPSQKSETSELSASTPSVKDDMDVAEFKRLFPGLSQKLGAEVLEADKVERKKLPPTVKTTTSNPVTTNSSKDERSKAKSLGDFIDQGFRDPEVLKAFNGE